MCVCEYIFKYYEALGSAAISMTPEGSAAYVCPRTTTSVCVCVYIHMLIISYKTYIYILRSELLKVSHYYFWRSKRSTLLKYHTNFFPPILISIYMYIYVCVYVCVCVCAYIYVHIRMYKYIYVYIYTNTHTHAHTHIHTHTHTHNIYIYVCT